MKTNAQYPPKMNLYWSGKTLKTKQGFTLIELIVAIFIFSLVMSGVVAVSVGSFRSYQKAKAVKTVMEEISYAIVSITKDIRMGKIGSEDVLASSHTASPKLIITRNKTQQVVRYEITPTKLISCECPTDACLTQDNCKYIVDLSGMEMTFNASSGFRNQKTDTSSSTKVRGWAQINFNVESSGMDTDTIRIQTSVSSRDYGWEDQE